METTDKVTRVQRTFAFIDVSGFTSFTDREGDETAVELLETIRGIVRHQAAINGVRIAKWLGDGAMLVGVEPGPTIAAVVAVIDHNARHGEMPLRAGLAMGDVILFEGDDHIGQAVNLAARLCDLANEHQILAPSSMCALGFPSAECVPFGKHHIEGIAVPVDLVQPRAFVAGIAAMSEEPFHESVVRVLQALSVGDVMTYGEVAEEAGFPGAARAVGRVLNVAEDLPWWRVIAANGRLVPGLEEEHAKRLQEEGVTVINGRVAR